MALDITLEHGGVIYKCGLSEHNADGQAYYTVDVLIPGTGASLSSQVHALEFKVDTLTGKFAFYSNAQPIPGNIRQLEQPLNEALQNLLGKPAT